MQGSVGWRLERMSWFGGVGLGFLTLRPITVSTLACELVGAVLGMCYQTV